MYTDKLLNHFAQPIYSEEAEKREAELSACPQLILARQQREKLKQDPFSPIYHMTAPEGGLNDPNGLCYWNGLWHLFYQAYPPQGSVLWGHTVSEDLVHWRDLPYAICPNPEEGVWSGTTLVEADRVIAMYYAHNLGNSLAVAHDPLLLNWEKLDKEKAIIPHRPGAPYSLYDPCIWKKGEYYYSLSGSSRPLPYSGARHRVEYLFRSKDLLHWEYLHPFIENDMESIPGDDGACPYFWPIGDKHILLHFSHASGSKYLIGHYDQERDVFVGLRGGHFNTASWYAGGIHAPTACPDSKGGLIVLFNINSSMIPPRQEKPMMSLPRRLTLTGPANDELGQEPVEALSSLHRNHRHLEHIAMPANTEIVLTEIQGNTIELDATFSADMVPMLEINVLRSPQKEEYTRISFYRRRGVSYWPYEKPLGGWEISRESILTLDTSYSSLDACALSRAPEEEAYFLAPDEPLRLQIFIDKSIVEVFANGRICLSSRVYPSREDSLGVSIRAQGTAAELISLDAWDMAGIY